MSAGLGKNEKNIKTYSNNHHLVLVLLVNYDVSSHSALKKKKKNQILLWEQLFFRSEYSEYPKLWSSSPNRTSMTQLFFISLDDVYSCSTLISLMIARH